MATENDAHRLYAWRNDSLTRANSHDSRPVDLSAHLLWLARTLADPYRTLLIAELDGVAVGTVRLDRTNGACELSWTVAPELRERGIGTRMVCLAAAQLTESIRAEIKKTNTASTKIASAAGMSCVDERDGILHFARPAVTS